jgi:hypothetical protein
MKGQPSKRDTKGANLEWSWTCIPWMVVDYGRQAIDVPADYFEGHVACNECFRELCLWVASINMNEVLSSSMMICDFQVNFVCRLIDTHAHGLSTRFNKPPTMLSQFTRLPVRQVTSLLLLWFRGTLLTCT